MQKTHSRKFCGYPVLFLRNEIDILPGFNIINPVFSATYVNLLSLQKAEGKFCPFQGIHEKPFA